MPEPAHILKIRNIFRVAIRQGRLMRPGNCEECGTECKPQGHHKDYSIEKALDVQWLCIKCHGKKRKGGTRKKMNLVFLESLTKKTKFFKSKLPVPVLGCSVKKIQQIINGRVNLTEDEKKLIARKLRVPVEQIFPNNGG